MRREKMHKLKKIKEVEMVKTLRKIVTLMRNINRKKQVS